MDDILRQSDDERRIYFAQAAARLGFPPAIVEKDFWVCWTLRELFSLRDWGDHFLFKGGTSLSKGYGYIRRFSEDIDIVIAREKLGFAGDHSLRNNQLKKLRKACQEAVGGGRQTCASSCYRCMCMQRTPYRESRHFGPG